MEELQVEVSAGRRDREVCRGQDRHVGHDAALVDEVVEQAKIRSERELGALVAERDELVKEWEYWNEAIRVAAPKIKPGSPYATSLEQLADWHESLRRAEHRHVIVSAKLAALHAHPNPLQRSNLQ